MRHLIAILALALGLMGTVQAARFEQIQTEEIKSFIVQNADIGASSIHDTYVYDGHYYDNGHRFTSAYKAILTAGQTEMTMVRQLVRLHSNWMADDVDVRLAKNVHHMMDAFVNEFQDEDLTEEYANRIWKYSDRIFELAKRSYIKLYYYGFSGRAYGNFAEAGFLLIDTRFNEVLMVGTGWSD